MGSMTLHILNPLTEALQLITGVEPPVYTHGAFNSSELPEPQLLDLMDWCSLHARPMWATGIGTLDAADLIVSEAVMNGNIAPK